MKLLNNKNTNCTKKCSGKAFDLVALFIGLVPIIMQISLFDWNHRPHYLKSRATLNSNDKVINLEVAREPDELTYGLKFRHQIPQNQGMLFVNSRPSIVQIWMKDVYIPLDMVFLKDGVIKKILTNVPPCQQSNCPVYSSSTAVDQVIEIKAWETGVLGLKPGEQLEIVDKEKGNYESISDNINSGADRRDSGRN